MYQPLMVMALSASILLSGCAAFVAGGAATTAVIAHDRRTAGTVLDDNNTELKIASYINHSDTLSKNSRIIPVVYNGIALLIGQTPTYEMRAEAERLAYEVPHVRHVYNEIDVASTPLPLRERSHDGYITSQIKSALLTKKNIPGTRIKVITENRVVYLMGLIEPEEEEKAVEIARSIKSVRKVVKMFEYLPGPAF